MMWLMCCDALPHSGFPKRIARVSSSPASEARCLNCSMPSCPIVSLMSLAAAPSCGCSSSSELVSSTDSVWSLEVSSSIGSTILARARASRDLANFPVGAGDWRGAGCCALPGGRNSTASSRSRARCDLPKSILMYFHFCDL